MERVRKVLEEELDPDEMFAEIEDMAMDTTNEAVRRVLEELLKKKAASLPDELMIDRCARRRRQSGTANYYSLCGTLVVQRARDIACG